MKYFQLLSKGFQKLKLWIKTLVSKRRKKKVPLYIATYVNDFPDNCCNNIFYVLGKPEHEWLAGMICPCGCGDFVELVLDGYSPRWELSFSAKGLPSLYPSICRSVNCRSHFFLEHGSIKWCH